MIIKSTVIIFFLHLLAGATEIPFYSNNTIQSHLEPSFTSAYSTSIFDDVASTVSQTIDSRSFSSVLISEIPSVPTYSALFTSLVTSSDASSDCNSCSSEEDVLIVTATVSDVYSTIPEYDSTTSGRVTSLISSADLSNSLQVDDFTPLTKSSGEATSSIDVAETSLITSVLVESATTFESTFLAKRSTVSSTIGDVVTVYTTWCPVESYSSIPKTHSSSSSTVTPTSSMVMTPSSSPAVISVVSSDDVSSLSTSKDTTIETTIVTSLLTDSATTYESTFLAQKSTVSTTIGDIVTVYTTWCPLDSTFVDTKTKTSSLSSSGLITSTSEVQSPEVSTLSTSISNSGPATDASSSVTLSSAMDTTSTEITQISIVTPSLISSLSTDFKGSTHEIILSTVTSTTHGIITVFTTWCPVTTSEIIEIITTPNTIISTTVGDSTKSSDVSTVSTTAVTLTDSSGSTFITSKTLVLSTRTTVQQDVTTMYTTWCPISETSIAEHESTDISTEVLTKTECSGQACSTITLKNSSSTSDVTHDTTRSTTTLTCSAGTCSSRVSSNKPFETSTNAIRTSTLTSDEHRDILSTTSSMTVLSTHTKSTTSSVTPLSSSSKPVLKNSSSSFASFIVTSSISTIVEPGNSLISTINTQSTRVSDKSSPLSLDMKSTVSSSIVVVLSTVTTTTNEVVSVYTTWCPISESSNKEPSSTPATIATSIQHTEVTTLVTSIVCTHGECSSGRSLLPITQPSNVPSDFTIKSISSSQVLHSTDSIFSTSIGVPEDRTREKSLSTTKQVIQSTSKRSTTNTSPVSSVSTIPTIENVESTLSNSIYTESEKTIIHITVTSTCTDDRCLVSDLQSTSTTISNPSYSESPSVIPVESSDIPTTSGIVIPFLSIPFDSSGPTTGVPTVLTTSWATESRPGTTENVISTSIASISHTPETLIQSTSSSRLESDNIINTSAMVSDHEVPNIPTSVITTSNFKPSLIPFTSKIERPSSPIISQYMGLANVNAVDSTVGLVALIFYGLF